MCVREKGCVCVYVRAFTPMHQTAGKQVAEEMLLCFSEGQYLCKWFIGLVFHNTQTANIDLTYDIQSFSDAGQLVFCLSLSVSVSLSPTIPSLSFLTHLSFPPTFTIW